MQNDLHYVEVNSGELSSSSKNLCVCLLNMNLFASPCLQTSKNFVFYSHCLGTYTSVSFMLGTRIRSLPQSHKHLSKELFINTSAPLLGHARRYINSVTRVVVLWASNYVNTNNNMYLFYRSFFRVNFAVKQFLCSF